MEPGARTPVKSQGRSLVGLREVVRYLTQVLEDACEPSFMTQVSLTQVFSA